MKRISGTVFVGCALAAIALAIGSASAHAESVRSSEVQAAAKDGGVTRDFGGKDGGAAVLAAKEGGAMPLAVSAKEGGVELSASAKDGGSAQEYLSASAKDGGSAL